MLSENLFTLITVRQVVVTGFSPPWCIGSYVYCKTTSKRRPAWARDNLTTLLGGGGLLLRCKPKFKMAVERLEIKIKKAEQLLSLISL